MVKYTLKLRKYLRNQVIKNSIHALTVIFHKKTCKDTHNKRDIITKIYLYLMKT